MPYSKISAKVSDYLAAELNYPADKREIIAYALDSLILMIAGFTMVMAVGIVIGVPGAKFFAVLSGGLLRQLSGGFHFPAPLPCLVFGAAVYPLVSWTGVQAFTHWGDKPVFAGGIISLCLVCLIMVGVFAPVDCAAKPIVSPIFRKKLKYSAIAVVSFFSIMALLYRETYIGISLVSGLTFQAMTLLPVLNKRKK